MHIFHKWKPIKVFHYNDTSYDECAPSTAITYMCTVCNKLKKDFMYLAGFITLDELTQNDNDKT